MKITTPRQLNQCNRKLWRQDGDEQSIAGRTRDSINLVRSFLARHVGQVTALRTNFFGHCYTRSRNDN
jgi:hypothetical protein